MDKNIAKLYLHILKWTALITLIYIPVYIVGFNVLDERLENMRKDSESKISYLNNNIDVINGNLIETPKKSFEIGDKGFFVNIDYEKEFTKEEVYKDLANNDMKYGYYFGKTQLVTVTKSGSEEINYTKFYTDSNLIKGHEIVWELEMHKDMYINFIMICLEFFSLFIAHLGFIAIAVMNQYYILDKIDKKLREKFLNEK